MILPAEVARGTKAEHALGIHGNHFLADGNFHSCDEILWARGSWEWSVAIYESEKRAHLRSAVGDEIATSW